MSTLFVTLLPPYAGAGDGDDGDNGTHGKLRPNWWCFFARSFSADWRGGEENWREDLRQVRQERATFPKESPNFAPASPDPLSGSSSIHSVVRGLGAKMVGWVQKVALRCRSAPPNPSEDTLLVIF